MIKFRGSRLVRAVALISVVGVTMSHRAMAGDTTVFEWRDAKGVLSYSQEPPPPGTPGVSSHVIDTKSFTPAQRAAIRTHLARVDAAAQADSARLRAQIAAADQAVNHALSELSAAERAARDGRSPQAGERIGNAGGGSRLRAVYFDRQKHLEDAIQDARSKVEEAYRMRAGIMR